MRLLLAALPFLVTTPLVAQTLTAEETALLPRVIDSLCIDLVPGSSGCEQVFLLENTNETDTADLIILTDRRNTSGSLPLLTLRQAVFNGAMWGMSPSLEETLDGQLYLNSEQIGIGRSPWMQSITLDWEEDGFVMTAFDYSTYDRAVGGSFNCSVDFRTGLAQADIADSEANLLEEFEETLTVTPQPVSEVQAFDIFPEFCETNIQRYFANMN